MSNVHRLPNSGLTIEELLEETAKHSFSDIIIVGYLNNEKGNIAVSSSPMALSSAYFMLEQAKNIIIEESMK